MSRHAEEYSDPCIEVTQEEDGGKEDKKMEKAKRSRESGRFKFQCGEFLPAANC